MVPEFITGSKFTPAEMKQLERTEALNEAMGEDVFPDETDPLKMCPLMPYKEAISWRGEQLQNSRERRIPDGWEIFLDTKRRMGRVMHHSEFLSHLRNLVPSLIVMDAPQPNRLSLYRVINKLAGNGTHRYVKFIGWIEAGFSPEYEINLVNEFGEPSGQRRGWRTILLRLQITPDEDTLVPPLTERQVLAEYGEPTGGFETAKNYKTQLFEYRNRTKE